MGAAGVLFAAVLAASPARADPTTYRIEPLRTRVEFAVDHVGFLRTYGYFARVSGRLVLDPAAQTGSIELDISTDSVVTGLEVRDDFIKGSTLFDAAQFPRMRFRSSRFTFERDKLVKVEGDLTMRDVTRPITLQVSRNDCGPLACTADADGLIRRSDFAMDNWRPLIGDEVDFRFHLVAVRE
jgi:polyisoprenoid-binding protein YceI